MFWKKPYGQSWQNEEPKGEKETTVTPEQLEELKKQLQALEEKLYPLFGVPDTIICDEHSSFAGKEMKAHCEEKMIVIDDISPETIVQMAWQKFM